MDIDAEPKPVGLASRFRMLEAFGFRDFRYLWLSSIAASFAMQMQIVARGWLAYDMTDSPLALGWVMLSFMAPSVVFSLFGGILADRVQKKPIMIFSQLANVLATGWLAWIIYADHINFWHFIYFGLFNGSVMSLSMPARSSIIPDIVGRRTVVNAMALSSATFNLSRIAGPSVAGVLIAVVAGGDQTSTTGVGIVFFVITALYSLGVIATVMLNYRGEPTKQGGTDMLGDLREGIAYTIHNPLLMGLLLLGLVPMTFGFAASFMMPVFNETVVNGNPATLGLLVTATGIGALFGSLVLAQIGDTRAKGRILFYSGYAWAIALVAFSLASNLYVALFFGAFTGLFGSVMGSLNMSIVQLVIPAEIRGRVMAIMWMTHGLMPLGMLPIAVIAEIWNIQVAIFVSAIALLISVWIIRYFYPEVRKVGRTDSWVVAPVNPTRANGAAQGQEAAQLELRMPSPENAR